MYINIYTVIFQRLESHLKNCVDAIGRCIIAAQQIARERKIDAAWRTTIRFDYYSSNDPRLFTPNWLPLVSLERGIYRTRPMEKCKILNTRRASWICSFFRSSHGLLCCWFKKNDQFTIIKRVPEIYIFHGSKYKLMRNWKLFYMSESYISNIQNWTVLIQRTQTHLNVQLNVASIRL